MSKNKSPNSVGMSNEEYFAELEHGENDGDLFYEYPEQKEVNIANYEIDGVEFTAEVGSAQAEWLGNELASRTLAKLQLLKAIKALEEINALYRVENEIEFLKNYFGE